MTLQYENDENSPYYKGKKKADCIGCRKEFKESDLNENDLCFDCALEKEEEEEYKRMFGNE